MSGIEHPSRHLDRIKTDDYHRQNINVRNELMRDVDNYLRIYQDQIDSTNCLGNHKITASLRARMTDWMIEVLTNFKCDDQTYFLAINL